MRKIKALSICLVLCLVSCAPRAIVKTVDETMPPWDPTKGFALINPDNDIDVDAKYLGLFALEDSGFTTRCDYQTMLNLAKEKAFAAGANIVKITKVKAPNITSTCYRIYGRFYYSDDFKKYETQIYRSENRKLEASDFKDDYNNRPSPVRSIHKIEFYWERSSSKGYWYFRTRPTFVCTDSYFNPNTTDESHLVIENLKFDITEKYARKWVKELKDKGITSVKEFDKQIKDISKRLEEDWDKEKDLFLYEIQNDPSQLKRWRSKLLRDLKDLEIYKEKKCLLKG